MQTKTRNGRCETPTTRTVANKPKNKLLTKSDRPVKKAPARFAYPLSRHRAARRLFRSWLEGDEKEQKETWAFLEKALDEDRLSDRKLFK